MGILNVLMSTTASLDLCIDISFTSVLTLIYTEIHKTCPPVHVSLRVFPLQYNIITKHSMTSKTNHLMLSGNLFRKNVLSTCQCGSIAYPQRIHHYCKRTWWIKNEYDIIELYKLNLSFMMINVSNGVHGHTLLMYLNKMRK